MTSKQKILNLFRRTCDNVDKKFTEQFGFHIKEVTFMNIANYLHAPKDSSSLAVTRILFGFCMLLDVPDERGGAKLDKIWGDPQYCHFPLLPFLQALPMPYMAFVYAAMWLGALGIMSGYKYRACIIVYTVCYWYILLIEKSLWNNHSYLFGLVAMLFTFTNANCYWSLDAYFNKNISSDTVPYWNYFLLKYQFFVLYFMAGVKKGTAEWLTGYSVQHLSEHWVFAPFRLFLTVSQIDYFVVHWFIFVFDLTVAFWMMWARTRHVAMIFCAMFHLMNSRLFSIGMFPWVCLATMPLFYSFDWPKKVISEIRHYFSEVRNSRYLIQLKNVVNGGLKIKATSVDDENSQKMKNNIPKSVSDYENSEENCVCQNENNEKAKESSDNKHTSKMEHYQTKLNKYTESDPSCQKNTVSCDEQSKKIRTMLIFLYVFIQAFLPFSHFITKGYNNWTDGLYGYSWDMMVHSWDTQTAVVKVVDNNRKTELFVDPFYHTINDRWTRHGDMIYQYAHCLKKRILGKDGPQTPMKISNNLSIYIDVWCSLNGRFTQRMFDPKADLIQEMWSPFENIPFLMPLLKEGLAWREYLKNFKEHVYAWNKQSDVIFFADFPGYDLEKFIPLDLENVTLKILNGTVLYEPQVGVTSAGQSYRLTTGETMQIDSGMLHRVINIDKGPVFYMFTFYNRTFVDEPELSFGLPIGKELLNRLKNMSKFINLILKSFYNVFFDCRCE